VERLEESKKKSEEAKKKRAAAQSEKEKEKAEKENEKSKRGGKKRKTKTPNLEPAASTTDRREGSSGFSLTQGRLVHGLNPTSQSIPLVPDTDECIHNLSVDSLLNDDTAFDDVLAFLDMVNSHSQAFAFMLLHS